MTDFILQSVPGGSGSTKWSSLTNPSANLTLNNGGNSTEFDQTSAVTWTWKNTTAATSGASQSSPLWRLNGKYWTGAASADDAWTIQDVIANGTNGTSTLQILHSAGTTGFNAVQVKNLYIVNPGVSLGINFKGASAVNGVILQDASSLTSLQDMILFKTNNVYNMISRSTMTIGWASGTTLDSGGQVNDTAISRVNAGVMAIGTGAQGNAGGNLQLNQITSYNGETPAAPGIPYTRGVTSQKSETGADASVLSVTPAAAAGSYRLRVVLSVSAANTATLGWTATWKDSNGNAQTPTNMSLFQTAVAAPALTFTTSAAGNYYADAQIDIDNSATAIVIQTTFSGTSIAYKITATIERIA